MQADAATARTAQTANAMEKDRLTLEKKAPTASKGTTADLSPPAANTNETPPQAGRNKKKAPAYFTAQVPGEKKVKKKIAKAAKATKAKKEAARNP
jgi:hypothetical protein